MALQPGQSLADALAAHQRGPKYTKPMTDAEAHQKADELSRRSAAAIEQGKSTVRKSRAGKGRRRSTKKRTQKKSTRKTRSRR